MFCKICSVKYEFKIEVNVEYSSKIYLTCNVKRLKNQFITQPTSVYCKMRGLIYQPPDIKLGLFFQTNSTKFRNKTLQVNKFDRSSKITFLSVCTKIVKNFNQLYRSNLFHSEYTNMKTVLLINFSIGRILLLFG